MGCLDLSGSVSGIHPPADAAQAVEALERKEGNPIRLILILKPGPGRSGRARRGSGLS
ncbi:hypothetical protein [Streptomyces sp. NPDC090112]|uniref:hypothetical protein n=1 Tax=Streptomyces sp. NPDC090112 TaxID=3365949 RepID=UPI00380F347C